MKKEEKKKDKKTDKLDQKMALRRMRGKSLDDVRKKKEK